MPVFNPQGRTKLYWVETIANAAAPTAAEITAGDRLDEYIVPDSVAGFTAEPNTVDATPLSALRERTVNGLATTTNGAITFYRGDEAADAEATLFDTFVDALQTDGYIVVVLNGTVATGELVDVFPSRVNTVNPTPPAGGQSARFTVGFTHPADFELNATIAAS